jgi:hypothetical protein
MASTSAAGCSFTTRGSQGQVHRVDPLRPLGEAPLPEGPNPASSAGIGSQAMQPYWIEAGTYSGTCHAPLLYVRCTSDPSAKAR